MQLIWLSGQIASMHKDFSRSLYVASCSQLQVMLHGLVCDLRKVSDIRVSTELSKLGKEMSFQSIDLLLHGTSTVWIGEGCLDNGILALQPVGKGVQIRKAATQTSLKPRVKLFLLATPCHGDKLLCQFVSDIDI